MNQAELTPEEAAEEGAEIDWHAECAACGVQSIIAGIKALRSFIRWEVEEQRELLDAIPDLVAGHCSLGDLYRLAHSVRTHQIRELKTSAKPVLEPDNWFVNVQIWGTNVDPDAAWQVMNLNRPSQHPQEPSMPEVIHNSWMRFEGYTQHETKLVAAKLQELGVTFEVDEFFDVVDEDDQVTGRQPRRTVHGKGLLHRAVHVWLFNTSGELLIHRRSATKEEYPSLLTSSAAGHLATNESYARAARRELREELGIHGFCYFLHKWDACAETLGEFTELFCALSDAYPRLQREEIESAEWWPLDDLEAEVASRPDDFTPVFRMMFRWYRRNYEDTPFSPEETG